MNLKNYPLKITLILMMFCSTFLFENLYSLSFKFSSKKEYLEFGLSTPILGSGISTKNQMVQMLRTNNKKIDKDLANYVAAVYISECHKEHINHDVAFSQMLLETNYLKFGNAVYVNQNNFAGIGVVSNEVKGNEFETVYLGVRAHIQHLLSYASQRQPKSKIVDPRFKYVSRGTAPTLKNLQGTWAADKLYDKKIFKLIMRLLDTKTQ